MHSPHKDLGLSAIDKRITTHFLSLRGYDVQTAHQDKIKWELTKFLGAFDLLCNLNMRDLGFANREMNALSGSELEKEFPEIFRALCHWISGQLDAARIHFSLHIDRFPSDFVATFMLHMFDFLHGQPSLYADYIQADKRCTHREFGKYYKGMLAFSLCERDAHEDGLSIALDACDGDPLEDIYSVHALVHCWHAKGEHHRVIDFLERRRNEWIDNPGMNIHVHWHLAVSYMERGQMGEAVKCYWNFRSLSAGEHAEQDLDAVNFCARIFLGRYPRPDFFAEYQAMARNWAPSIYNSLSYFNDTHAAFAFMMSGEKALMKKLLNRPPISRLDARTQEVGTTILLAISDFMEGNFDNCANRLESTRQEWCRIGGSRAQREILDTLAKASRAVPSAILQA